MSENDGQNDLRAKIMAIMRDTSLTEAEKAQKRQELMCGGSWSKPKADDEPAATKKDGSRKQPRADKAADDKADLLEDALKCVICFNLCERPITGPCQHNYCLGCFTKWTARNNKSCPTCRAGFPKTLITNPRINTLLTHAIRCAKQGIKNDAPRTYNRIADDSRPAEAFTTERAVRNGRANAASGRIMVNVPNDYFGPILPEHDPTNGKGVQVGDWWKDRLDCRQWGAHFPHVAGIAGQSNRGAQSVVLSGGYEDDHDEGEWFLYTGSGGRDLSGNKRTNKEQSFDQTFENMNKALKLSCLRGLPVRVVRSYKEKRSSYAPTVETPVRYDGIYRILRSWRTKGAQGHLMCRYLFVRCDNAPAPWTSDEAGDQVRLEVPDLAAKEIKAAQGQVFEMGDSPYWDYDLKTGTWGWAKEQPASSRPTGGEDTIKKLKKKASAWDRLKKEFSCALCKGILDQPLSMPCGHNFCKKCLDSRFAELEAASSGGSRALQEAQPVRTLRHRKMAKPCPTCKSDVADFLSHAAVNTEMDGLIKKLQAAAEEARAEAEKEAAQLADEQADEQQEASQEQDGDSIVEDADKENQQEEEKPLKKQKVDKPAADSAAADAAQQQPKAALAEKQATTAPPAAALAPAAVPVVPAEQRYAAQLAQLRESFPDFDQELILCMLEDQGGDALEVHAALKRMKNQLAHAKRQAAKAASVAAGEEEPAAPTPNKGRKTKGRKASTKGKKQKGDAAADDAAAEEQQQEQGGDNQAAAGDEAAAVAAEADETMADGAVADEQTDIQLESDKSGGAKGSGAGRKAAAKGKGAKAAAASGPEVAAGDAVAAAEEAAVVGKKKRGATTAGSGRASKRAK